MTTIIICGVLIVLVILLLSAITAVRRGVGVALHMQRFNYAYAFAIRQGRSKECALLWGLRCLQNAHCFRSLSERDYELIIKEISNVPHPEEIIEFIVMQMPSDQALRTLKNSTRLKQLADAQRTRETRSETNQQLSSSLNRTSNEVSHKVPQHPYGSSTTDPLNRMMEDSFRLAREYVAFMKKTNSEAGSPTGIFRKIDYISFSTDAAALEARIYKLRVEIFKAIPKEVDTSETACALREYIDALCEASYITRQKTDLMLKLSKEAGSVSWSDFKALVKKENRALQRCQSSGDKLNSLYFSQ